MANYPIEDLLPRAGGSIYRLVRMAALRALELADGKPPLTKGPVTDKLTTVALEEILKGKILCKDVADKLETQKKKTERKAEKLEKSEAKV